MIAYESLRAKREVELEELYTWPFEDIVVEEFLDQLPKPQIEEVEEPEPMDTTDAPKENAETPMDTSGVDARTGDLPQGEMPDSAKTEAPDVPMETEAPESSSHEEATGAKVEPAEASPSGEEPAADDERMGDTEEVKEEDMEGSPHGEETMPPDISPEKDDGLHDQGIWGRAKTVFDPESFKAAASAEAENEKAFENMGSAKDMSSTLRSSSTSAMLFS